MHHRSKRKVFDRKDGSSSIITTSISSLLQKLRTPSTFTLGKNPHLIKNKLHSKSTYFYRWGSKTKLSAKFSYVIPSVCTLALLVGGIVAINPLVNNIQQANAIEGEPAAQASTASTISLQVTPNASDSTNSAVQVGNVAYFSNNVTVSGSNIAQYSLTLNTPAGSTGDLVGRNNPYATVSAVNANTAPANFQDNTWGYAVSNNTSTTNTNMTYNPVPVGGSSNSALLAYKKVNKTWSKDSYKLVFAAKFSGDMPTDHYVANVYISAVGSAQATVKIGITNNSNKTISTMQEMTASFCDNMSEEATGRLKDSRDNKVYWVTKLKDGNCWMTQNLDYDGGGTRRQTTNEWSANTLAQYYDHGMRVLNGSSWVDVSGAEWFPYDVSELTSISDDKKVIDNENKRYDAHYLSGNYYSWGAAKNSNTSESSTQGVCPAGWILLNQTSWNKLYSTYALSDSATGSNTLRQAPFYISFFGTVSTAYKDSNFFGNVGANGYLWGAEESSISSASAPKANELWVGNNNVRYNGNGSSYNGMPVRCIYSASSSGSSSSPK